MHDAIINERLRIILDAIILIERRIKTIRKGSDFYLTETNIDLLDSIVMRLQQIGENVNKIKRIDSSFLMNELSIEQEPIIGLRNIVSHDYDKTNPDIIYDVCINDIPILKSKINEFLKQ